MATQQPPDSEATIPPSIRAAYMVLRHFDMIRAPAHFEMRDAEGRELAELEQETEAAALKLLRDYFEANRIHSYGGQ